MAQDSSAPAAVTPTNGSANAPALSVEPPNQRVVLKVGDLKITQAAFETMVSDLEEQQGPADLSHRQIAENYAQLLSLAQLAIANHLDQSPQVQRQLAIDRNQILSNAAFAKLKAAAKPTPEEISTYYNAHLTDYDTVDVRRLFIWTKTDPSKSGRGMSPQDAKALATAIRQAIATGNDPKKLIQNNTDVMLDEQPLPFQRGEMPDQMEKAAFSITKEGEWSQAGDAPETLVYLQLVKRGRVDLKEATPQIEKKLQAEKLREELKDAKKDSGIWMDEQYFGPPSKAAAAKAFPQGERD